MNSNEKIDGQDAEIASNEITKMLAQRKNGERCRNYRLRDWLVSRQRSWGAPIPIIHCEPCGGVVPVPESDLPVRLPSDEELDRAISRRGDDSDNPSEASPLAHAHEWKRVKCPKCGSDARRDTDTLDTFVDSSWYYLHFLRDGNDTNQPWSVDMARDYMPVNEYVGGVEHAILHLLYSRFVTRFLHDKLNLVPSPEPFESLLTQGMVLGRTVRDKRTGRYLQEVDDIMVDNDNENVEVRWEKMSVRTTPFYAYVSPLELAYSKILSLLLTYTHSLLFTYTRTHTFPNKQKSKQNGVDPLELVNVYGSDVTRLAVLFAAPAEKPLEWDNERSVRGVARWLNRLRASMPSSQELSKSLSSSSSSPHDVLDAYESSRDTIHSVTRIMRDGRSFNVAIAELMKLSNILESKSPLCRLVITRTLLLLLSPMAPEITSEMWENIREIHNKSLSDDLRTILSSNEVESWAGRFSDHSDVHEQNWPLVLEESRIRECLNLSEFESQNRLETYHTVVVQIAGKKRGTLQVPSTVIENQSYVEDEVRKSKFGKRLDNDQIRRVVYIVRKDGGALINYVL